MEVPSSDEDDTDSMANVRTKKKGSGSERKITISMSGMMAQVMQGQERVEARINKLEANLETKMDSFIETVGTLLKGKAITKVNGGAGDNNGEITSTEDQNAQAGAAAEEPEPPQPTGVTYDDFIPALEDFLFDATDDHWDKLLIAAMRGGERAKLREHVYMWILKEFSEDDIDNVQQYYLDRVPTYIKVQKVNSIHYKVLAALASELIANGKVQGRIDGDIQEEAFECQVLIWAQTLDVFRQ